MMKKNFVHAKNSLECMGLGKQDRLRIDYMNTSKQFLRLDILSLS